MIIIYTINCLGNWVPFLARYTDNAIVHHGVPEKGVNFIQKPFIIVGLINEVKRFWIKIQIILVGNPLGVTILSV
jgi:hypothetical protein